MTAPRLHLVKRNMYDCLPCPECREEYRFPMGDGLIHCDDCGFVEPWDDHLKAILPVARGLLRRRGRERGES